MARLPSTALRTPARTIAVGLLLAVLSACGSDDGATDPGPLAELAGTWEATSMVVTSQDDPETGGDITQPPYGATFVLEIRADGRYTATLTVFDQTDREDGELGVSGSTITFDPDGVAPPRDGTWSLEGGILVIDGETSFDFNNNGTPESADLHLELVRS